MRSEKVLKRLFWVVYGIVLILLFLIFSELFFRQTTGVVGSYWSDLPAHINFGLSGNGYSLIDIVLGWLAGIDLHAVGYFVSALVIITIFGSFVFIKKIFNSDSLVIPAVFSVLSVILVPLYIPYVSPYFDLTGIVLQPWHSPTYIGMRAGAVWVMIAFSSVCEKYKTEGLAVREWLTVTALLAITTWIKPNFLIAYSLTLLLLLIVDYVKSGFAKSTFKHCFTMGCTVLPAFAVTVVQSVILFDGSNTESNMIKTIPIMSSAFLKNGGWAAILQILTGLLFPAFVYILGCKITNRICRYVAAMFSFAFLQILFFAESGSRSQDNNFYWGIYVASYFVFLVGYALFDKMLHEVWKKKKVEKVVSLFLLFICLILILWHAFSGVLRFAIIYSGFEYNGWPWIIEPYFKWMYDLVY